MIELKDYTNGKEPTHYSITKGGLSCAYSNSDDMDQWVEDETIFNSEAEVMFGSIEELNYKLVDWKVKNANIKKGSW